MESNMGKEAEVQETEEEIVDELEVEEEEVEETETDEEVETEEAEEQNPASEDDDDDDEVIVTIGDEAPPQEDESNKAPQWVRDLRKDHREVQKENRALKEELKALKNPTPKPTEVGKKPALDDPDIDYDTEKYEQKLSAWHERKRKADEVAAEQDAANKAAEDAWQQSLSNYGEAKTELKNKLKDFDDVEGVAQEALDQTQNGIIIHAAGNPALVIYALGKNPDRVKELASIKDPIKFTYAVAQLEKDMKLTNRKKAPAPEKRVDGSGSKSGASDSKLGRLRAEAAKTGNYDKVTAYRRKLEQQKK